MSRVLVLDVIGDKGIYEAECSSLIDFYRELRCDCFDVVSRIIGGKRFDVFCDDVGLFVDNPIPSAFDNDMHVALVGNLVFANHDRNGNTTSLSDEDIECIKDNVIMLYDYDNEKEWNVIFPMEYR